MNALAFGVVCAAATGVALFWWFRRSKTDQAKPESDSFSPNYEFIESGDLRESARLAELQIKEADEATTTLEKKAVLLITLCIALLAYLVPKDFGERDAAYALHDIIRAAAFLFAALSATIAAKVVDLGGRGVAGLGPKRIAYYAQYYPGKQPMDLALRYTLEKYQGIIDRAAIVHTNKVIVFKQAKDCLLYGIACTSGWVSAEVFVLFEPCLAETIAKCLAHIGQ